MKITEILDFIHNNEWVFAKTMPEAPHEYVVKNKLSPFYKTQFERLAKYIRIFGRTERYLGTHPARQYLYVGGYKYWTMGAPIQSTIILNRAQVDPNPYDLMQYETLFTSTEDLAEEKELVECVLQAFNDQPRIKTVLDVGCGDGLFIRHTDYPEEYYTGIDPSVRMLTLFAQNHPSHEESIFLGRAEDARLTAYRIADNKAGENSQWDFKALIPELREITEIEQLQVFFKEDLTRFMEQAGGAVIKDIEQADFEAMAFKHTGPQTALQQRRADTKIEFACPHCGELIILDKSNM